MCHASVDRDGRCLRLVPFAQTAPCHVLSPTGTDLLRKAAAKREGPNPKEPRCHDGGLWEADVGSWLLLFRLLFCWYCFGNAVAFADVTSCLLVSLFLFVGVVSSDVVVDDATLWFVVLLVWFCCFFRILLQDSNGSRSEAVSLGRAQPKKPHHHD